jgi:hypothetical protein
MCRDAVETLPQGLAHPLVRRYFSAETGKQLLRLWTERESFLAALTRLPQTLCHLDAFRRNLGVLQAHDRRAALVAIDWACAGVGAVGEELASLVASSLIFFEADVAVARELDQLTFASYLEGLRDAGWRINPAAVRFGYTAAAALRYGLGLALDVRLAADAEAHAWVEQVLGHSVEEMVVRDAAVAEVLLAQAAEARRLLPATA